MSDESNSFMSTLFIPHIKADIVHPAKHNNINKCVEQVCSILTS